MTEYTLLGFGTLYLDSKINEASKKIERNFKEFVKTGRRQDTSCYEKLMHRENELGKLKKQKKESFAIIKKRQENNQ